MEINENIIHNIFQEASKKILDIYSQHNPTVNQKTDHSPVTEADILSNDTIVTKLKEYYPDIPVISEENPIAPYRIRSQWDYYWLLDPLDGTKEFIHKTDEFVINLALVYQQEVVAGFVYVPCFKEFYFAKKGKGAFLISEKGTIKLKVSPFPKEDDYKRVPVSRFHPHVKTENYLSKMGKIQRLEVGSALKILYIALGRADIYPRLSNLSEWDIAAPQIILEESGGSVLTLYKKQKMFYGRKSLKLPHFVASSFNEKIKKDH
jgi:3'(2'), 5'-bisphosphate nucleotidase